MELSVNFDIDCLRSFLVIADTMSFSRAAETVGRSQSTISQQIAKLETQVGKALLTRRKGRVLELTSEGGKLVQYARKILQLNDEAYASMSDDVLTGFVRLGVPLDFFGRDFTTWLARFKNRHPMVGLEVEANQSENLMKRSMRGELPSQKSVVPPIPRTRSKSSGRFIGPALRYSSIRPSFSR